MYGITPIQRALSSFKVSACSLTQRFSENPGRDNQKSAVILSTSLIWKHKEQVRFELDYM